jgi:hypothetical protein
LVTVLLAASRGEQAGFRHVRSEPRVLEDPHGGLSQGASLLAQARLKADFDAVHEHLGAQCPQLRGTPLRLVEQRQCTRQVPAAGGHKALVVDHLGTPDGLSVTGEDRRCRLKVLVGLVQFTAIGMDKRAVLLYHGRLNLHAGGFESVDCPVKIVACIYDPAGSLQSQGSLGRDQGFVGASHAALGFVEDGDRLVKTPDVDPLLGQGYQSPC